MADDHTQGSELEDVIRRAELQLEEKLEELRMMRADMPDSVSSDPAMVDDASSLASVPMEAADMRPTGVPLQEAVDTGWDDAAAALADDYTDDAAVPSVDDVYGEETGVATLSGIPSEPQEWTDVSGESPVDEDAAVIRPTAAAAMWGDGPIVFDAPADDEGVYQDAWDTEHGTHIPSEQEQQFWSQTRSSLRMLQQATDDVVPQVAAAVSSRVERVVRDELAEPVHTIRSIHFDIPEYVDRMERALASEVQQPLEILRALNEELPRQIEEMERNLHTAIDQSNSGYTSTVNERIDMIGQRMTDGVERVERRMHDDVGHVEQVVATNVTRMAQGLADQLDRLEHSVKSGFEAGGQVAQQSAERFDELVREELEAPLAMLRQIQDELPSRFARMDRSQHMISETLRDELLPVRRYVSQLSEMGVHHIVQESARTAQQASERMTALETGMEHDRVQRAADLELLVDSMSSGWNGLYGSVEKLLSRIDVFDRRMTQLEHRLDALGKLEPSVQGTLTSLQDRLDESLASMESRIIEHLPAPVVVTVNHPNAEVSNETNSGYVFGGQE